jgi:hypothetical protein
MTTTKLQINLSHCHRRKPTIRDPHLPAERYLGKGISLVERDGGSPHLCLPQTLKRPVVHVKDSSL